MSPDLPPSCSINRPVSMPSPLRKMLEATAQDPGPPKKDTGFGWGRIDAAQAFAAAGSSATEAATSSGRAGVLPLRSFAGCRSWSRITPPPAPPVPALLAARRPFKIDVIPETGPRMAAAPQGPMIHLELHAPDSGAVQVAPGMISFSSAIRKSSTCSEPAERRSPSRTARGGRRQQAALDQRLGIVEHGEIEDLAFRLHAVLLHVAGEIVDQRRRILVDHIGEIHRSCRQRSQRRASAGSACHVQPPVAPAPAGGELDDHAGQCFRTPSCTRKRSDVGRIAQAVAHVNAPAPPPPQAAGAGPARPDGIGTAGFCALVGWLPVMATEMMAGVVAMVPASVFRFLPRRRRNPAARDPNGEAMPLR